MKMTCFIHAILYFSLSPDPILLSPSKSCSIQGIWKRAHYKRSSGGEKTASSC